MSFYKRKELPIVITALCALLAIFAYFLKVPAVKSASTTVQTWMLVMVNFAVVVGFLMVIKMHKKRIDKRQPGDKSWLFSVWLIVLLIAYVLLGIYGVESTRTAAPTNDWTFNWIYNNAVVALDSAMYSLLAFFIASASFRAFKARTKEAGVLLISGAITMLYNAPAGSAIFGPLAPSFNDLGDWILNVPNMAGFRGILIGAAVGAISLGIRVLTGRERGYLGAGE
jgi:hypothetical protein